MLTQAELSDTRARLKGAKILVEGAKATFFSAGRIESARLLNEITNLLSDEIAALDKEIAAGQP
jgi:hypothetical protein